MTRRWSARDGAGRHARSAWRNGFLGALLLGAALVPCGGCGGGGGGGGDPAIVVTTDVDSATPPTDGTVTLRAALDAAPVGTRIVFDPSLDGGTITLTVVGEAHSMLAGEVYDATTGKFQGYADRDYGASALYARKDVTVDASGLPHGITIAWGGGAQKARVLAVYGDLTMTNVRVTGGESNAVSIGGTQGYTLARGAGLAVWGTAHLVGCTVGGNTCSSLDDTGHARDRGTYGGGVYANGLDFEDCVIGGNAAVGFGAAGGGLYSVGGADRTDGVGLTTSLRRCAVTGNRVTAQHAYGGGIFTLGGGPNATATMRLESCTLARNLVEANTEEPPPLAEQFYYRGGGLYMGGGSVEIVGCTVAENEVWGHPATFGSTQKPNMGGGGVTATIGNAHVVTNMVLAKSVVVGNRLNGAPSDVYSGSLIEFYSLGYNLVGALDFSQILVPIPPWASLSRKHYPKVGDLDGVGDVALDAVLDVAHARRHDSLASVGVGAGEPVVLWYPPADLARDRIPRGTYTVPAVLGEYAFVGSGADDFLVHALDRVRLWCGDDTLGSAMPSALLHATFYPTSQSWPSDPLNRDWIGFWRALDAEIGDRLGAVRLGDDFWGSMFATGVLEGDVLMSIWTDLRDVAPLAVDQTGAPRAPLWGSLSDIGAVED